MVSNTRDARCLNGSAQSAESSESLEIYLVSVSSNFRSELRLDSVLKRRIADAAVAAAERSKIPSQFHCAINLDAWSAASTESLQ